MQTGCTVLSSEIVDHLEWFAKLLHEAGREAVQSGLTQNPSGVFIEWEDAPERTKEGRRSQARFLLNHSSLTVLKEE